MHTLWIRISFERLIALLVFLPGQIASQVYKGCHMTGHRCLGHNLGPGLLGLGMNARPTSQFQQQQHRSFFCIILACLEEFTQSKSTMGYFNGWDACEEGRVPILTCRRCFVVCCRKLGVCTLQRIPSPKLWQKSSKRLLAIWV